MAASTGGAQAVWAGESRMLSSFSEVTGEATPLADVELPTPLAFYDFEGETEGIEFKADGIGTVPYSIPLSETEKGLSFTRNGNADNGYVQMANPFLNNSNIESQGATISLWVYLKDNSDEKTIWGFGQGAAGYEGALPKLSFSANTYFLFNHGVGNLWVDYNRNPNTKYIQTGQMAMATVVMGNGVCQLYVNGALVSDYPAQIQGANNLAERVNAIFPDMKAFPYFYLGKGSFDGTFSGHADKLGFYDKALTAEEVAALYEEQKVTYDEPQDVTSQYITNADFSNETDVLNGWERTGEPERTDLGMPYYGDHAVANFYQDVTLPAGVYNVSVQANAGIGGRVNFYVNSALFNAVVGVNTTMGWNDDGYFKYEEAAESWTTDKEQGRFFINNIVVREDDRLRIGIDKFSGYNNAFVFFDNFRLERAGFAQIVSLYEPLRAAAESIDQDRLPVNLATSLETILSRTPVTAEDYSQGCVDLQTIVSLCNYYIENNMSELPAYLELCKSDMNNSTGADDTALENAISALEAIDWNTITVDELQQAYNSLVEAHRAYQAAATPIGDHQFDMTYLLTNPNPTSNNRDGWHSDILGEKNETVDGEWVDRNEHGVANNGAYQGETQSTWFVEKWSNDAWDQLDGNGWTIYQRAIVPAGAYQMTAATFTDLPYNALSRVSGVADASLTVGFGSGTLVDGAPIEWVEHERFTDANEQNNNPDNQNALKYREVSFTLTEAATAENPLKLGIYIGENNDADWFGINDMKLYKVAPKPVELTLNETEAYSVTADTYANVTLTRSLKADDKWNTFCVPFDMTAEQLTVNGISEVRRFSGVSTSGNSAILEAETVSDGVKAGVPYIVQVSSSVSEIEVDDVTVQAAAPTAQAIGYADAVGQVSITGNYSATTVPTGAYFISDNVFYVADAEANVTLNGFRAYITVEGGNEASQVNRLLIDIDGEVTAIEDVLGESAADSAKAVDVYTLSGVKVKSGVKKAEALDGLQRGIYIVDGQKMTK